MLPTRLIKYDNTKINLKNVSVLFALFHSQYLTVVGPSYSSIPHFLYTDCVSSVVLGANLTLTRRGGVA